MRERIARGVCLLVVLLVLGLSLHFASQHNRQSEAEVLRDFGPPPPPDKSNAASSEIARGRAVFEEQNCAPCHSIEGACNPRYPLDGVAERLNPAELLAWITGTGAAADS